MVYILLFLAMFSCLTAQNRTVGLISQDSTATAPGYTLFAPVAGRVTYLINNKGQAVHTWQSAYPPGQAAMLLPDGSLLRTGSPPVQAMGGGGAGGVLEKYSWDGTLLWKYDCYGATYRSHHDVEILPNGNVLLLVWDSHTVAEALAAGRIQSRLVENALWSERIIEVKQTGPTSGEIVWSWSVWDHLIQDADPSKPNFGVVADHPERFDINAGGNRSDWLHANSVRYNAERDEVLVSLHNLNELIIISRKSSDIVYRWGNPQNYKRGTVALQRIWGQHDARWLDGATNTLMVFNNGIGRPGGNASSVDVFELPLNPDGTYRKNASDAYEPLTSTTLYPKTLSGQYFAQNISGATRMPNGNLITCLGPSGTFIEATPDGREVWRYVNPVSMNGITSQGGTPRNNMVFKIYRYPPEFPAFQGKSLTSMGYIEAGPLSVDDGSTGNNWTATIDRVNDRAVIDVLTEGHYTLMAYNIVGGELGTVLDSELPTGRHVVTIPRGTIALVRR